MAQRDKKRLREVATGVQHRVSEKLSDVWWAFMLRGLLALAVAACAFFWPQKTMAILVKLLGAYFIVDGLAGVASVVRSQAKSSHAMQAVVSLASGLVLLFWTGISTKLFLIVTGIWGLLQGIGLIISSRSMEPRDDARGLMAVVGAVVSVIGLVLMVWPNTGLVAVSWLIAVAAAVVGVLLIFLATRLKRVSKRIDRIGT